MPRQTVSTVPGEVEALDWDHQLRVQARPPGVRVELAWVSTVEARRDYSYPEHRHHLHEIVVPVRGAYRCLVDDRALSALPGQALIVQPGDRHQDRLRAGQRYRAAAIRLVWQGGGEGALLSGDLATRVVTVALGDLLDQLERECAIGDAIAARRQDALAEELLWRLVRALPPAALAPAWHSPRERFTGALERVFREHAARGLTVAAMAKAMGLSPGALTAACREHLGAPPARALAQWRVAQAQDLLRDSGMGVAAVAARLGFANPFHFARVVRRHTGRAPSALRSPPGSAEG